MKKSQQTIEESLSKIKFMMSYDSSKTLTEQLEYGSQRIFGPSNREQLQKYFQDLKQMFDYAETYKEQLSKIPRGLNDEQISVLSKTLYSTMQGLGLNKKPVANVFETLKSASDFVALNDSFNSTYGAKQDLYTWITKEVGMGRNVQSRILTSLQNLTTKAAENLPTKNPSTEPPPIEKEKVAVGIRYERSTGEEEDPYRYGTEGDGIKTIQELLGLVPDGRFGPKTRAALAPFGIQTFTKYDVPGLQAKIQGKEVPQEAPERNITQVKPTTAPTAQLKGGIPKFGQPPPQKLA
jgi:hypothetical protein